MAQLKYLRVFGTLSFSFSRHDCALPGFLYFNVVEQRHDNEWVTEFPTVPWIPRMSDCLSLYVDRSVD